MRQDVLNELLKLSYLSMKYNRCPYGRSAVLCYVRLRDTTCMAAYTEQVAGTTTRWHEEDENEKKRILEFVCHSINLQLHCLFIHYSVPTTLEVATCTYRSMHSSTILAGIKNKQFSFFAVRERRPGFCPGKCGICQCAATVLCDL